MSRCLRGLPRHIPFPGYRSETTRPRGYRPIRLETGPTIAAQPATMATAAQLSVEALAEELAQLRELVLSRVRLHRKEVLQRYSISKDTLYRRMKAGKFP